MIVNQRILGLPFRIAKTTVDAFINRKDDILSLLKLHGCICLKGVNWTPRDLKFNNNDHQQSLILTIYQYSGQYNFTKGIWADVIELPQFLSFNNQDPIYKQVGRVGNINVDGTMKDSQKQGAYWHRDGDFWSEEKMHVFNILQSKIQPTRGGQTHIMDIVHAIDILKQKDPRLYEQLLQLQGDLDFEQIPDFKMFNAKKTLQIEPKAVHRLVKPVKWNGRLQLYVSHLLSSIRNIETKQPHYVDCAKIIIWLEENMGYYAHQWKNGDVLIWDNFQVMHRSSGSFEGKRLIYRTQGRLL